MITGLTQTNRLGEINMDNNNKFFEVTRKQERDDVVVLALKKSRYIVRYTSDTGNVSLNDVAVYQDSNKLIFKVRPSTLKAVQVLALAGVGVYCEYPIKAYMKEVKPQSVETIYDTEKEDANVSTTGTKVSDLVKFLKQNSKQLDNIKQNKDKEQQMAIKVIDVNPEPVTTNTVEPNEPQHSVDTDLGGLGVILNNARRGSNDKEEVADTDSCGSMLSSILNYAKYAIIGAVVTGATVWLGNKALEKFGEE